MTAPVGVPVVVVLIMCGDRDRGEEGLVLVEEVVAVVTTTAVAK